MTAEPTTTLVGNLTRDPELRYTPAGNAVASLTVAVDAPDRTGEPTYRLVTAWRDLAEHVALSVVKGDRVVVVGTTSTMTWTGRDGAERSEEVVTAKAIGPDLRYSAATPLPMPRHTVVEDEDDEDALGSTL